MQIFNGAVKKRRKTEIAQGIGAEREENASTTDAHAKGSATASSLQASASQSSNEISGKTTAAAAVAIISTEVLGKVEASNSLAMLGGYSSEEDWLTDWLSDWLTDWLTYKWVELI